MVYLVGGYILTPDQVLQWSRGHNIDDPTPVNNMTLAVNYYLRERHIPTRLLAVTFREEDLYLVVTARRTDSSATETQFEPFKEDSHALSVKAQINVGDVEFVTVPNPYCY